MNRIASPQWLLLFLPLIYSAYRMLRRAKSQALPYSCVSMLPRTFTWRQKFNLLPPMLMIAGLALVVIAASRPQTTLSKTNKAKHSIAIEMTVDVSGSMMERDLAPPSSRDPVGKTRLDIVKETFAKFVELRPDDMIGLVAFGGYATTRCPLTLDHTALLHVLKGIEVPASRDPMETMTAIGDGLAMACARLAAVTNIESKIVILLSDGENNAGIVTPEEAISVAKEQGIKVYSIGMGNPDGVTNPGGMGSIFHAMMAPSHGFDETLLKHIAQSTGGRYFNVRNESGLNKTLEEIDRLQKTKIEEGIYMRQKDHFAVFLVSGSLLVLVSLLLSSHSRRSLI